MAWLSRWVSPLARQRQRQRQRQTQRRRPRPTAKPTTQERSVVRSFDGGIRDSTRALLLLNIDCFTAKRSRSLSWGGQDFRPRGVFCSTRFTLPSPISIALLPYLAYYFFNSPPRVSHMPHTLPGFFSSISHPKLKKC